MRTIGIEMRALLKTTLIHILVYLFLMIAALVTIRIINADGSFLKKIQNAVSSMPETLQLIFSFAVNESLSVEMKTFLAIISIMFFPIIYYASKIVLSSLEKEEDNGTISFLYNDAKSRVTIITGKYIAGIISYLLMITLLCGVSMVLIVNTYSKSGMKRLAVRQLLDVWGSLLAIGILLMTIGTFYAAIKRRESSGSSFIFGIILWTTLIGIIPYVVKFMAVIVEKTGRNVDTLYQITDRLGNMKYFSFIYWCLPIRTYNNPPGIIFYTASGTAAILMLALAVIFYNRREFGE